MTELKANPKVSVVVPVFNGGPGISATIEHLLGQSLTPHEIIIIDDGSTDDTPEILKTFGDRIVTTRQENAGPAAARNTGIRMATGDFIAFTDSDCCPQRDWLSALLKGFDSPRVAGVGGTVRGIEKGLLPEYADVQRLYDPGLTAEGNISYLVTCNACIRREVLLEVGLFDERFRKPGGEEPDLCMRIKARNYELRAVADALVLHHKKSFKNLMKAQSNYGEGGYMLGRTWPEYRWKGSPRRGLVATILSMPLLFRKFMAYRPKHGLLRALAFSFLDRSMALAATWGYFRGERMGRKG